MPSWSKVFLIVCVAYIPYTHARKASKKSLFSTEKVPKTIYYYTDRDHTLKEDIKNVLFLYAWQWGVYVPTQFATIRDEGSWRNYRKNFMHFVFDQDEPIWNLAAHPMVGSLYYLTYRASGYSQFEALKMAFIQSAIFETTIEIITERPSIQDLYQTPILGSMLGFALERVSLYFLNTDNSFLKVLGHIMNPPTLFDFFEHKVQLVPYTDGKQASLQFGMSF